MLPTLKEMTAQSEEQELCYAIDRRLFAAIKVHKLTPDELNEPAPPILFGTLLPGGSYYYPTQKAIDAISEENREIARWEAVFQSAWDMFGKC